MTSHQVKFQVHVAGSGSTAELTGTYSVTPAGVLSVKAQGMPPTVFAPGYWQRVVILDAPSGLEFSGVS